MTSKFKWFLPAVWLCSTILFGQANGQPPVQGETFKLENDSLRNEILKLQEEITRLKAESEGFKKMSDDNLARFNELNKEMITIRQENEKNKKQASIDRAVAEREKQSAMSERQITSRHLLLMEKQKNEYEEKLREANHQVDSLLNLLEPETDKKD